MSKKFGVALVVVVVVLALSALPVAAQPGVSPQVGEKTTSWVGALWQRVAGGWEGIVSVFEEEGGMIDPAGQPATSASPGNEPRQPPMTEEGSAVDPWG